MDKISAAFVKAQKAFGPALKTATNPHFRVKYANLSDCIEAVIDALNEAGIAMMQVTHPDDSGVSVETKLIHESGESLSSGILHVPAYKNDPQGYGSALTYARRYSLMAACGIAPEDDDGHAASKFALKQPAIDYLKLLQEAAINGMEALKAEHTKINPPERLWLENSKALKAIAIKADASKNEDQIPTGSTDHYGSNS
jgi:ERF superfamily